jgi:glyoxylase-like metal-dependent hydrolase (beta-lactamase superfamily II)
VRPWLRNTLIALAIFTVILGVAYYWLLVECSVPSDAHFALDLSEVRRLASSMPGDKPNRIEVEQVGRFEFPSTAVVAGDGWAKTELPVYSYRVVYPATSAIIDTALDAAQGGGNLAGFDAESYARMQGGMAQASLIVITHEHMDHLGGLTKYPKLAAIAPAVRLTREQLAHPELAKPAEFSKDALALLQPLAYGAYQAVAPGIVLIKSPGHTPGSQMIFVQTSSGEYLFIGDVAWHFRNIELKRERARLITDFFLHEDRTAVFGQLVALHQLHEAEPKLHIVPGHDGPVVAKLVSSGALASHWSVPAATP